MSVTARFQADFSGFIAAIDKAEVALVDMSKGASKVEGSLNRMVDNFSGRKLIQEASLMTIAVEKAGGVSTLTAKELERVGAVANEAADKLRKLGSDVPSGLQKLADATKGASSHFDALKSVVSDVAASLAAMFTVRAVFNFAKDVIEQASALKDLSQQTHINVEDLQLLAGSMSEFGVDADTLGKGLFKLSRGIAGGDESVARALHMMGMSLKDVEGLNGKDLFLKIESGLATLQGGLRDTAAADLFGGKLGAAMAGASEGIGDTMTKWQALNHVASTESVDAMDTFGESIARANKNISSIAANMIGPLAQGFNVLNDAADKGASKWAIFWASTKDALAASTGLGTGTENLTRLLDDLNKKTEENTAKTKANTDGHTASTAAIDTRSQAVKFMAALEADASVALDAAQYKNLAHLKEIGALNAQNANAIGVTAAQYAKYVAMIEQAAKTLELEKEATKILQEFRDSAHKRQVEIVAIQTADQLKLAAIVNDAITKELDARVRLNAAYDLDAQGHIKVTSAAETLRIGLDALHLTKQAGIDQTAQEQVLLNAYTETLRTQAIAQGVANVELGKVPGLAAATSAAIDGVTKSYWAAVDAAAALAGIPDIGHRPPSLEDPGWPRPPTLNPGGGLHPLRDSGGAVTRGRSYLIGMNKQPELFTPGANGFISPLGGGGGSVVNHFYVNGSADDLARTIADKVLRTVMQAKKLGAA